jgi:hypothetical protein
MSIAALEELAPCGSSITRTNALESQRAVAATPGATTLTHAIVLGSIGVAQLAWIAIVTYGLFSLLG